MDPSDIFIEKYGQTCKLGAILELRMRLLAGVTFGLEAIANHRRLEVVEEAIIKSYKSRLTQEDESVLTASRQIRNKVIHGDFKEAIKKIENHLPNSVMGPLVHMIDLGSNASHSVTSLIGEDRPIFGWLTEMGLNGGFEAADEILGKAIQVITKLADFAAFGDIPSDGQ